MSVGSDVSSTIGHQGSPADTGQSVAFIILAAGKSTRMGGESPKVLHEVCGRPMLAFVLEESRAAGASKLLAVVGHGKDAVISRFSADPLIGWVEQTEQRGTGHAALCCRDALRGFRGTVVVIAGDMPLVRRETLKELIRTRIERGDAASIATTELDAPAGYGRIVRSSSGDLEAIVEHRDASPEQLKIREVNPSYYCFDSPALFEALDQLRPSGEKGELYLTDAIGILRSAGKSVSAVVRVPSEDATGVNTRRDLADVNRMMQQRIQSDLLSKGATIVSPENTWIEADVSVGTDSIIFPFSFIGAGARLGRGCRIGPFACVAPGQALDDGCVVGRMNMEAGA